MANEDFEEGREFEGLKRDLVFRANKIISDLRSGEFKPAVSTAYMLLVCRLERIEKMMEKYYPSGNSAVESACKVGRMAIEKLERRLGPAEITKIKSEYQMKYRS